MGQFPARIVEEDFPAGHRALHVDVEREFFFHVGLDGNLFGVSVEGYIVIPRDENLDVVVAPTDGGEILPGIHEIREVIGTEAVISFCSPFATFRRSGFEGLKDELGIRLQRHVRDGIHIGALLVFEFIGVVEAVSVPFRFAKSPVDVVIRRNHLPGDEGCGEGFRAFDIGEGIGARSLGNHVVGSRGIEVSLRSFIKVRVTEVFGSRGDLIPNRRGGGKEELLFLFQIDREGVGAIRGRHPSVSIIDIAPFRDPGTLDVEGRDGFDNLGDIAVANPGDRIVIVEVEILLPLFFVIRVLRVVIVRIGVGSESQTVVARFHDLDVAATSVVAIGASGIVEDLFITKHEFPHVTDPTLILPRRVNRELELIALVKIQGDRVFVFLRILGEFHVVRDRLAPAGFKQDRARSGTDDIEIAGVGRRDFTDEFPEDARVLVDGVCEIENVGESRGPIPSFESVAFDFRGPIRRGLARFNLIDLEYFTAVIEGDVISRGNVQRRISGRVSARGEDETGAEKKGSANNQSRIS